MWWLRATANAVPSSVDHHHQATEYSSVNANEMLVR